MVAESDGLVHTEVIRFQCAYREVTTSFYSSSSSSRFITRSVGLFLLFGNNTSTAWQRADEGEPLNNPVCI